MLKLKSIHADSPGVMAPPPVLYLGAVVSGLCIQFFDPIHLFQGWLSIGIGILLIIGSSIVILWGIRTMKHAGTNVNPERPATAIVQTGPFRFSRNPLYISMSILQLGLATALSSFWLVATLVIVLFIMTWGVILREERYLEKKFGQEYMDYKLRVRRWL